MQILVKKKSAFTLIEVMVALVLLAFSMGAVISSISSNSFQLSQLRDRFHANRVAMHVAGDFYLKYSWPKIGIKKDDINVGNAVWEWEAKITNTSKPKLRRVEIQVFSDVFSKNKGSIAKHILFVSDPYAKTLK